MGIRKYLVKCLDYLLRIAAASDEASLVNPFMKPKHANAPRSRQRFWTPSPAQAICMAAYHLYAGAQGARWTARGDEFKEDTVRICPLK